MMSVLVLIIQPLVAQEDVFKPLKTPITSYLEGIGAYVHFVHFDAKNDAFYIGTQKGVAKVINGDFQHPAYIDELKRQSMIGITTNNQGMLWVCTNDGIMLNLNNNQKHHFNNPALYPSAFALGRNYIWISDYNTGIHAINWHSNEASNARLKESLKGVPDKTYDVVVDAVNHVWIASESGLFKFDPKEQKLSHLLKDIQITALTLDLEASTLYAGSINKLYVIRHSGKVQEVDLPTVGRIKDLTKRGNTLWAVAHDCVLSLDFKRRIPFPTIYRKEEGYNSDHGISITFDHQKNVWVGTAGNGIFTLGKTQKTDDPVNIIDSLKEGKQVKLDHIQFQKASTKLLNKQASYRVLNQLVHYLKENSKSYLEVYGHTDNSGQPEKLKSLSLARANVVKNYLIEQEIDFNRISTFGYGMEKPIASNDSQEGAQLNRRVECRLKLEDEMIKSRQELMKDSLEQQLKALEETNKVFDNLKKRGDTSKQLTIDYVRHFTTMRAEATVYSTALDSIPLNTTCEVLEKTNKLHKLRSISALDFWYRVLYNGKEGWVFGYFTSLRLLKDED